jgi:DNA modification methylase
MATPRTDYLTDYLPRSLQEKPITDTTIPSIARDAALCHAIEQSLCHVPTQHKLYLRDARDMSCLENDPIHLIVTSPPYWTLKRYREGEGQLGHLAEYDAFLDALDNIWKQCYERLVPGGRLICVVGDVCLSRRKNNGRHTVVPLHASIQERCRKIGFDNLAPIIWHKIANAAYEVEGSGGFLGSLLSRICG